jgi:hypothetical protein
MLKRSDAYDRMRKTTYFLAGDRAREVHSKSVYATNDDSGRHRTILVASSEHPIAEYARRASVKRDNGELARFLSRAIFILSQCIVGREVVRTSFADWLVPQVFSR